MTNKTEIIDNKNYFAQGKNGLFYKKYAGIPFTGIFQQHYFMQRYNGQLEFRTNYKDGKKHGLQERFYENGRLKSKANFKDGNPNGLYETYYENGRLKSKANFKDGNPNGLYETYYENGRLKSKGNFKNGEEDEPHEWFNRHGELLHIGNHCIDVTGETVVTTYKWFYGNGQLKQDFTKKRRVFFSQLEMIKKGWIK